jgi:hypothetical protein
MSLIRKRLSLDYLHRLNETASVVLFVSYLVLHVLSGAKSEDEKLEV